MAAPNQRRTTMALVAGLRITAEIAQQAVAGAFPDTIAVYAVEIMRQRMIEAHPVRKHAFGWLLAQQAIGAGGIVEYEAAGIPIDFNPHLRGNDNQRIGIGLDHRADGRPVGCANNRRGGIADAGRLVVSLQKV